MRVQNEYQHEITNSLPCQRGLKKHLNMCWPIAARKQNVSQLVVTETHTMPAKIWNSSQHVLTKLKTFKRGHKVHLNLCWANHSHVSEYTKYISTSVDHAQPLAARKQYVSQLVLNKYLLTLWRDKIYLTLCCPNPSRSSEDTKYIPTCIDQTPTMGRNVSQHVVTISPMPAMRKMYLNMWRPNTSNARDDTKCISTFVH